MNKSEVFTICIVHYMRLAKLKKTVYYLLENTSSVIKIIILNNGYIDLDTEKYFDKLNSHKNIEIIKMSRNVGAAEAKKILLNRVDTQFFAIIDDDTYFKDYGWEKEPLKKLKQDIKIGGISFMLKIPKKSGFTSGGINIKQKNKVLFYNNFASLTRPKKKWIKVDAVSSGVSVFRYEIIKYLKNNVGGKIIEDWQKPINLKKSPFEFYVYTDTLVIHDKEGFKSEYSKHRRNYKTIRSDYLNFISESGFRLDLARHIFYKYFCLLPDVIIKKIVSIKLKYG